jgi:hypothetical protein
MKREIRQLVSNMDDCCPGHDSYPSDTYSSRRSKKARSKGIKREHKYVRHLVKQELHKLLKNEKG